MNERQLLRDMFEAAIAAASPDKAVPPNLPPPPRGRTVVVGAGKAAASMARAVEAQAPEQERQHRSRHRAEGYYPDQGDPNGERHQIVIRTVIVPAQVLPRENADYSNDAEDYAKRESSGKLADRHAPPVAQLKLAQR